MTTVAPRLDELVRQRILAKTGNRIEELSIDVRGEMITISGLTSSFYLKQLAQHGVQEILPAFRLQNTIRVKTA